MAWKGQGRKHELSVLVQAGRCTRQKGGPASYRDIEDHKGVLFIKRDFCHFDAIIVHEDRVWKQKEEHQARCQETQQDRQEDILFPANGSARPRRAVRYQSLNDPDYHNTEQWKEAYRIRNHRLGVEQRGKGRPFNPSEHHPPSKEKLMLLSPKHLLISRTACFSNPFLSFDP